MQTDKKILLVRVIALVTAGTVIYNLFLRGHWYHWQYLFMELSHGINPYASWHPLDATLSILLDLIVIGKLLAAYSLFELRAWGRKLAIVVLSVDFLMKLAGAINWLTWPLRHPERLPIPNGAEVFVVSMWPSFIIGAISLISIIILMRKFVKEVVEKPPTPETSVWSYLKRLFEKIRPAITLKRTIVILSLLLAIGIGKCYEDIAGSPLLLWINKEDVKIFQSQFPDSDYYSSSGIAIDSIRTEVAVPERANYFLELILDLSYLSFRTKLIVKLKEKVEPYAYATKKSLILRGASKTQALQDGIDQSIFDKMPERLKAVP